MEFVLPSYDTVIQVHDVALQLSSGTPGLIHRNHIDAALKRPNSYMAFHHSCTIHIVCAILLDSLARNHAFLDGNKRTALLTTLLTYNLNNVEIRYSEVANKEYGDLVLRVVKQKPDIDETALRLEALHDELKSPQVGALKRLLGG